jgi:PKD repeat protein
MRGLRWRLGAALAVLAAFCLSCGSNSAPQSDFQPAAQQPTGMFGLNLPAPQSLVDMAARSAAGVRRLAVNGSQTDPALAPHNAAPAGTALTFTPAWTGASASPEGLALALYRFTVTGYFGAKELHLSWSSAPADNQAFLAVADFTANRWRFVPLSEGGTAVLSDEQFAAAVSPGMCELLAIPVVAGTAPLTLDAIRIGADPGEFQLLGVSPTTVAKWDIPVMSPAFTGEEPVAWEWNFGAATSPAVVKAMNPDPWFTTVGTFDCSVTATLASGATATFPFVMKVLATMNEAPRITTVWPNAGETGASVNIAAMTEGGYADVSSWNWDFGGGATPNATNSERPTVILGAPGAYACHVSCSNAQGASSRDFTLYVVEPGAPLPPCFFGASCSPYDLYAGTQVQLSAMRTGGGQADTYAWDFGGAGLPATSTDAEPVVTLGAAGTYHGTVTGSNAAGTSSAEFTLVVRQPNAPDITSVYMDDAYTNLPLRLTPMLAGGDSAPGSNWLWDFGGACEPNSSAEAEPEITPLTAGTYHCSVMTSNAAGSDQLSFEIVVTDPAAPQLDSVWEADWTTTVASTVYASNTGGPTVDWAWTFPAALNANTTDQPYPTITPGAAGTYNCSVTTSNVAGSSTLDFVITVHDMLPPPITGVSPLTLLSGQSACFVGFTNCNFLMTWTWDFGGGCTPNTSTDEFPVVQASGAPGTYNGVVTATNAGGTTTYPFTYTINPLP